MTEKGRKSGWLCVSTRGWEGGKEGCEMQLRRLILYVVRCNGLLPSIAVEKHSSRLYETPMTTQAKTGRFSHKQMPLLLMAYFRTSLHIIFVDLSKT